MSENERHEKMLAAGWEWDAPYYKLPMDVGFCAIDPNGTAVADPRYVEGVNILHQYIKEATDES